MKLHVGMLAVALITSPAGAAEDLDAVCSMMGTMAKEIMLTRQAGVPMSEVRGKLLAQPSNPANQLIATVILEAYQEPRYSVEENQQRAADDFRNKVELSCYSNF